jgi:hypothetical protein
MDGDFDLKMKPAPSEDQWGERYGADGLTPRMRQAQRQTRAAQCQPSTL